MMNTTFSKDQVNEAIARVLRNPSKKDCKEDHKVVEAAGYNTWKNNGHWFIQSKETGKYVGAEEKWQYVNRYTERRFGYRVQLSRAGAGYSEKFTTKLSAIDFVSFLDTPANAYEAEQRKRAWWGEKSASMLKYDRLVSARRDVQYHKDQVAYYQARSIELIQKLQAEIESCQKYIASNSREQIKDEQRLEALRKELGL